MSSPTRPGRADTQATKDPAPADGAVTAPEPPSSRRPPPSAPSSAPPSSRAPSSPEPSSSRGPSSVRPIASRTPLPGAVRKAQIPPVHPLFYPMLALHAAAFFTWSWLRHRHFGSAALDLGGYQSVFWNLAHGGTPWNSVERAHQWSSHLELGLTWIAVLFRVAPSPAWLFGIQALACAATAIPIEAIARRITADRVASLIVAAAMLVTPQLVLAELTDFHSIVLCALPMAVIAWGIEANSSRTIALAGFIALLLREQMGLFLVAAGIAWVLRQGKKRLIAGVLLAIVGAGVFVLATMFVIPAFGSAQSMDHMQSYKTLGGDAPSAIAAVRAKPLELLALAFDARRRGFLLELASGALPLLLVSLRSMRRTAWPLVLALPQLASQLLSDAPLKTSIASHYGAPIVPMIAAACALSLYFIPRDRHMRRVVAGAWLLLVMVHGARALPWPSGRGMPIDRALASSKRAPALARAIAALPPLATVSAQDNLVPHVANRPEVHLWPDGERTDDYIFLDAGGISRNVKDRKALIRSVSRLRSDPAFELVVDEAGVMLAKRLDQADPRM